MSYGPDTAEIFRRSSSYVDRILKSESPGNLPVQSPTQFELASGRVLDRPEGERRRCRAGGHGRHVGAHRHAPRVSRLTSGLVCRTNTHGYTDQC